MFHDQAPTEFEERLTRPIDEFIQDGPPGSVSDRAIDVHMANDMQAWTCMSTPADRRCRGVPASARADHGRERREHRFQRHTGTGQGMPGAGRKLQSLIAPTRSPCASNARRWTRPVAVTLAAQRQRALEGGWTELPERFVDGRPGRSYSREAWTSQPAEGISPPGERRPSVNPDAPSALTGTASTR